MKRFFAIVFWLMAVPMAIGQIVNPPTGGGAPSGPAGGALAGTYPNPTIANGAVSNAALANPSTTVNGQTCTLGSACAIPTGTTTRTALVGTRTDIPSFLFNSTQQTWLNGDFLSYARTDIPANSMQVIYPNFYLPQNTNVETVVPGTTTVKVAIEYPPNPNPAGAAGPTYPCTFSSSRTGSMTGLIYITSDVCTNPAIPNGAPFRVRTLVANSNGIPATLFNGHYSTNYDVCAFGTGTPVDTVDSGITNSANCSGASLMYVPIAIIGPTSAPTVCIHGDSRAAGIDVVTDYTGDTGLEARIVGPVYAYTKFAQIGLQLAPALVGSNYALRTALANAYCSNNIDEYGFNDINTGNQTAAQVVANRTSFAAKFIGSTIGTTLLPITNSTDNYATTTNQSLTSKSPIIAQFNQLATGGIPGEQRRIIDEARALDPLLTGLWPVSYVLGATSGSLNFIASTTNASTSLPILSTYGFLFPGQVVNCPGAVTGGQTLTNVSNSSPYGNTVTLSSAATATNSGVTCTATGYFTTTDGVHSTSTMVVPMSLSLSWVIDAIQR